MSDAKVLRYEYGMAVMSWSRHLGFAAKDVRRCVDCGAEASYEYVETLQRSPGYRDADRWRPLCRAHMPACWKTETVTAYLTRDTLGGRLLRKWLSFEPVEVLPLSCVDREVFEVHIELVGGATVVEVPDPEWATLRRQVMPTPEQLALARLGARRTCDLATAVLARWARLPFLYHARLWDESLPEAVA